MTINKFTSMSLALFIMGFSTSFVMAADPVTIPQQLMVSVSAEVDAPASDPYYNGQAMKIGGSVAGLAGTGVVSAAQSAPGKIKQKMADADISAPSILREEFLEKLEASKSVQMTDSNETANATLKLSITKYGLSSVPFKRALQPVVAAKVSLVAPDGKVLWSYTRNMTNHSDREIPIYLFEEYMDNIELLRAGYMTACEIVASDLVTKLNAYLSSHQK